MSGVVGAWLPPAEDEQLLQQLAPMLRALQQRGRGRIGYWTDAEAYRAGPLPGAYRYAVAAAQLGLRSLRAVPGRPPVQPR